MESPETCILFYHSHVSLIAFLSEDDLASRKIMYLTKFGL